MLPPKIDSRKKEDLIEQLKEIVPYYTPEWRFTPHEPDPGTALFIIFAHLFYGNIKRFNRVPLKNFISFLNILDVSLHPPKPSTSYVTFQLTEGANENIPVKKGTKVLGRDEAGKEIIFEVDDYLLVTPAKLLNCYQVSTNPDMICEVPKHFFNHEHRSKNEEVDSFFMYNFQQENNLQSHSFYISHHFMFNISSSATIEIHIQHPFKQYKEKEMAKLLANSDYVEWLYYADGTWQPFDNILFAENKIILQKTKKLTVENYKLHDIEAKWIQCKVHSISIGESSEEYLNIEIGNVGVKSNFLPVNEEMGFLPDMLFQDDIHILLDEEKGFYPFGQYFIPFSTFYLSSDEAFSKKGSTISLTFKLKMIPNEMKSNVEQPINWKLIMKEADFRKNAPQPIHVLKVNWEYWNGNSWVILPMDEEYSEIFYDENESERDVKLQFTCPKDISETLVNSQSNYWIRARIISIDHIRAPELIYYSPWIEKLRISYNSENNFQFVEECISENNLEWKNEINILRSDGQVIKPFTSIKSSSPAFYFGFDRPIESGPISIFFDFKDAAFKDESRPIIEWEYLRKKGNEVEWTPLTVFDHTNDFTKSGDVRFFVNNDSALHSLFSKNRYWIRALNRKITKYNTHIRGLFPKLRGIYLNTTKVVQQEHIHGENPNIIEEYEKKYIQLAYFPVLSEEVWIDEESKMTEEEITNLVNENNNAIKIIRDSDQNIQRCWVLWKQVANFIHSNENDRHYVIDRSTGKIFFGDGKKGKKPPKFMSDYIQVHYKIGGGTRGNIDKFQIQQLESSIPFIDSVYNPVPAGGGANIEKLEEALNRGPHLIKHQNRAVTVEDFEWLVREATQNVAKVKCLANYNAEMKKEVGCITIVVLPENGISSMHVFPQVKAEIEQYLLAKVPSTIAFSEKIHIIKPALLEISLSVILVVNNVEMIVETEIEAKKKLEQFLNPLSSSEVGGGWDIGQPIHISVFYSFFKSLRHVNFVEKLYMTVKKIENGKVEELEVYDSIYVPHGIVVNGKHTIQVKVL